MEESGAELECGQGTSSWGISVRCLVVEATQATELILIKVLTHQRALSLSLSVSDSRLYASPARFMCTFIRCRAGFLRFCHMDEKTFSSSPSQGEARGSMYEPVFHFPKVRDEEPTVEEPTVLGKYVGYSMIYSTS